VKLPACPELQIGGAEISDNLAFLPGKCANRRTPQELAQSRLQMGLVRENSGWKLLSVGLVLLDCRRLL